MKRFELIYNGVSSIFNASESGNGYTSKHNKALSYWVVYTVRPSKTNTLGISKLFEQHNEDGLLGILSMQERALNLVLRLSLKS